MGEITYCICVHIAKLVIGVFKGISSVNEEGEAQLLTQTERAARAGTVVMMGDFNYPKTYWCFGTDRTIKGWKLITPQFYGTVYGCSH